MNNEKQKNALLQILIRPPQHYGFPKRELIPARFSQRADEKEQVGRANSFLSEHLTQIFGYLVNFSKNKGWKTITAEQQKQCCFC